ncbi:MAG: MBL fold metallo-hydrolase [Ruminiclostridium sp.]|nr:MBL fold metallo-hydrolase [Ruminiclostridium sp.]
MKHHSLIALILIIAALFAFSGCAGDAPPAAEPSAEITVFGIGKADAILVRTDGCVMLIDCGEASDGDHLISELDKRGITRLDILQITHFDKDHVGGAAAVLKKFGADTVLYPGYTGTNKEYESFAKAADGLPGARAVTEQTSLTLGPAELTVYPADDPEKLMKDEDKEYDNNLSLVTKIRFGSRTFLFCGDIENARIKQMLKSDTDWYCDWIKLPHHGKFSKRLGDLLEAASPKYSVMTVSASEPADEKTTALLAELSIKSYDTLNGNIVTACDGSTITVSEAAP